MSHRDIDARSPLDTTSVVLHLRITHAGGTTTLVFDRLPVRIGRDELYECRLEFPFISRAHAVLELRDGALVLRDLGSTIGTFVRDGSERVSSEQATRLADVGNEFTIGELRVHAELKEIGRVDPNDTEEDAITDADTAPENRGSGA